jgi:hypothetical protein
MDILSPLSIFTPFDSTVQVVVSPSLPYDLAEAIMARYTANASTILDGLTAFYKDQADDRAIEPYAVYSIKRGSDLLTSDIHYIYDQRVTFTAHATSQDQAERLRIAINQAFGTGSFDFQTGYSIPFFTKDHREGKSKGRTAKMQFAFTATIEYSARTERY